MPALLVLAALISPVPGEVVRAFDYGRDPFAAGRHRGVDLRARPGEPVVAPCPGTVVAAGAVAGVPLVSLRCGRRRVSVQPLGRISVRAGVRVVAGAPIGTVGAHDEHRGLHLGVRREGDPFGYVDPEPLLAAPDAPPPVVPAAPRRRPHLPRPGAPRRPIAPLASDRAPPGVPWPVWPGLALVLAGAGIGGLRLARPRVARWWAWNRASA